LENGDRITGYPVLEDDVWVGPHAVIVGGVTIGKGSRILACTFVWKDVPPGSLVSGNPAQIVKHNVVRDVFNPFTPS
jgi:serine O-acetyltransferase